MTGRQRYGLITVAALAVISGLVWTGRQTPEQVILGGKVFTGAELRAAQAALKQAAISGVRVAEGRIYVPPSARDEAERLLSKDSGSKPAFGDAYEKALSQSAWPVSESHRQELMDSARANELIAMFRADPNIADARLMWNRTRRRSFGPEPRATAILGITPHPGRIISPELAESLRLSVVSAFGLASDSDVTLIEYGQQGARVVRDGTPSSAAAVVVETAPDTVETTTPDSEMEDQEIAEEYRAAIERKLAWIPQVKVDISRRLHSRSHGVAFRDGFPSAARHESLRMEDSAEAVGPDWKVTVSVPEQVTRSLAARADYDLSRGTRAEKSNPTRNEVRRRIEQAVARCLEVRNDVPRREYVEVEFCQARENDSPFRAQVVTPLTASLLRHWPGSLGLFGALLGAVWLVPLLTRRRASLAVAVVEDAPPELELSGVRARELEALFQDEPSSASEPSHEPSDVPGIADDGGETREPVSADPPARSAPQPPSERFTCLRDCSADEWQNLFAGEHPQTISLILSHLPQAQSAFVLRLLGASQRLEVVRRLSALEVPPSAVMNELELIVEQRLRNSRLQRREQIERSRSTPELRGTLAAAPADSPRWSQSAPGEVAGLAPAAFTELRLLDDGAVRELFSRFGPAVWATALKGADVALQNKLRDALPSDAAQELEQAVRHSGPVRLSEVDAAQQAICVELARVRWRGRRRSTLAVMAAGGEA